MSAAARARAAMPLVALSLSCAQDAPPPPGQLIVWVDTDAPLVRGSSLASADPLATSGLFDRLRIEVLDANGEALCADCARDFVVTQEALDAEQISFGVRLASPSAAKIRARLFPARAARGDEPVASATIDRIFAVPAHGAEGRVDATLFLAFDDVGKTSAGGEPPAAIAGRRLSGKRALPAVRPSCTSAPLPGEVCVPGGAYWAGGTLVEFLPDESLRPIVLRPFFLDAHEVTVSELRDAGVAERHMPRRYADDAACTFTDESDHFDLLPVTCVDFYVAEAYCAARGASLPTVAQLEYVRSGLRGDPYVWGVDPPTCDDAVWSRSGAWDGCAALGDGPLQAGTGARDRLTLPGGTIFDLAGNVAELLGDQLSRSCRLPGVAYDPVCVADSSVYAYSAGSFRSSKTELLAGVRTLVEEPRAEIQPHVGFRCARADR